MKAVVALVGAFSVITNLRMELFEALIGSHSRDAPLQAAAHSVSLSAAPAPRGGSQCGDLRCTHNSQSNVGCVDTEHVHIAHLMSRYLHPIHRRLSGELLNR